MAEGLLRHLAGDRYESLSAGARPAGWVHPLAIEALAELGLDIASSRSKSILEFVPPRGTPPDLVISVCDAAARECPVFPGAVARLHWPFHDPIGAAGTKEEKMRVFRRVRDQIRTRLEEAIAAGEIDATLAARR
jgi:arsenate reductase